MHKFASMQENPDICSMICTNLHLCKRRKLCCQIYSIHCIHPIFAMNTHNMIQNYHKIIHSEWVTGFGFGMHDIPSNFPKFQKVKTWKIGRVYVDVQHRENIADGWVLVRRDH